MLQILYLYRMNEWHDIRWKQRFESFDASLGLLREAMANGPHALNQLEKEGAAQRFEFCFELAWKCLKDYLQHSGVNLDTIAPRQTIKEAFAAKILADGKVWIDMLDHRNLLSHTYNRSNFEQAVEAIHLRYLDALQQLHAFLAHRMSE